MHVTTAYNFKRRTITCIGQHGGGIAAHQHGLAGEKAMMVVKIKEMRMSQYTTVVDSYLSVVFANIF
jgi:hypothetical protein